MGARVCDKTWPSEVATDPGNRDVYRQHRCGQGVGHLAPCLCQYCGCERKGSLRK